MPKRNNLNNSILKYTNMRIILYNGKYSKKYNEIINFNITLNFIEIGFE